MTRPLLALLFAFAALLTNTGAQAQALPGTSLDSIVAIVDEDVILRSDLDRALAGILAQYADRRDQLPPRPVLEKQVLERLVLLRLQLQRAQGAGIRVADADIDRAVAAIAQQNRISPDQMRAQLAKDGLDFAEFRDTLRDELTAQRLRQSVIQSRVQISESEVDIALASSTVKRGQVRVAHIMVGVPESASQEQLETARKKIEGIRELVTKGEMEFNAAAIRYSDGQNALEGGDLGFRGYDELPSMFSNLVAGMKNGDVSQVLRAQSGFHILKLVESREEAQETITEYHARNLLVKPSAVVSSDEARKKVEALRARIVAGEAFDKLAREHSEDSLTRDNGGDMGWFQAQAWGTSIAEQMVRLKDSEISPVFLSDAGWHLVQKIASRVQDVTEQSLRARARETIGRRKSEEEFERFLRNLRDEAYIEIRLPT